MLLEKLVEVIDTLGKWPTVAELKLYGRQHSGFPNHKTIRRLGK